MRLVAFLATLVVLPTFAMAQMPTSAAPPTPAPAASGVGATEKANRGVNKYQSAGGGGGGSKSAASKLESKGATGNSRTAPVDK